MNYKGIKRVPRWFSLKRTGPRDGGRCTGGKIPILTLLDQLENHIILFFRLDGHQVHAVLPADVSGFQPVDLGRFVLLRVSAVEVIVTIKREFFRSCKH